MLSRHRHKDLTWIDLESPSPEEVRQVMEEFDIDPTVAEELLQPSGKGRAERHGNLLYVVLHFPTFRHSHAFEEDQEIDFVIGKHFLITARYDLVDSIHKFSKVFDVGSILHEGEFGDHAGYLFFYLIRKLYRSVEHELDYVNDHLHEIEEHMFSGFEKEMVVDLSHVSRVLLSFRHSLMHHDAVLESLEHLGRAFFGDPFSHHIRVMRAEYARVKSAIEMYTSTIAELRDTNDSLLSSKQNEVMKMLTMIAVITFPLTLMAAIFAMDTRNLPIPGDPDNFEIVLGAMGVVAIALIAFFKHKRWF